MKRLAAIGLVLAAGLGLSACGSHPATKSYIDGWNAQVLINTEQTIWTTCNEAYKADDLPYGNDLWSDFKAGCDAAGVLATQTYQATH